MGEIEIGSAVLVDGVILGEILVFLLGFFEGFISRFFREIVEGLGWVLGLSDFADFLVFFPHLASITIRDIQSHDI